jgi:proteic killer suppression protein
VRHKGLRRLLERDDDRSLRKDMAQRVRNVLTALISAPGVDGVRGPPGWRIHRLAGDRTGTRSISVSGNLRLTVTVASDGIHDLDLEDYH